MVVIITSTGGVSKMLSTFDGPVDPGLVAWAGEYLNERLLGLGLGARMVHQRLAEPSLSVSELASSSTWSRPSAICPLRPRNRCMWMGRADFSRPARLRTRARSTS